MGDGGGSSNAPSSQQPGAPDSGGDDQERTRYRLWLSTMVESLTSFFSQHGINSSDSVDVTPAPTPQPPTATTTTSVAGSSQARQFPGIPPRPGTSAVPQSFPYVSRFSNAMRDEGFVAAVEEGPTSPTIGRPRNVPPPWRVFPRVEHVMGGGTGAAGISFGGAEQGPGQQRWTLRRNAESQ